MEIGFCRPRFNRFRFGNCVKVVFGDAVRRDRIVLCTFVLVLAAVFLAVIFAKAPLGLLVLVLVALIILDALYDWFVRSNPSAN